jgi:hypothetical protein
MRHLVFQDLPYRACLRRGAAALRRPNGYDAHAQNRVDGATPILLDLSRKAPRVLVENAALVLAQPADDVDIENIE